jgi:hypothetical protein
MMLQRVLFVTKKVLEDIGIDKIKFVVTHFK